MKNFKDLTEEEKAELRKKFARMDLESIKFEDLYDLALQKRTEHYEDEGLFKETLDFHKEMEQDFLDEE